MWRLLRRRIIVNKKGKSLCASEKKYILKVTALAVAVHSVDNILNLTLLPLRATGTIEFIWGSNNNSTASVH